MLYETIFFPALTFLRNFQLALFLKLNNFKVSSDLHQKFWGLNHGRTFFLYECCSICMLFNMYAVQYVCCSICMLFNMDAIQYVCYSICMLFTLAIACVLQPGTRHFFRKQLCPQISAECITRHACSMCVVSLRSLVYYSH